LRMLDQVHSELDLPEHTFVSRLGAFVEVPGIGDRKGGNGIGFPEDRVWPITERRNSGCGGGRLLSSGQHYSQQGNNKKQQRKTSIFQH
jgi:hypothetical protein